MRPKWTHGMNPAPRFRSFGSAEETFYILESSPSSLSTWHFPFVLVHSFMLVRSGGAAMPSKVLIVQSLGQKDVHGLAFMVVSKPRTRRTQRQRCNATKGIVHLLRRKDALVRDFSTVSKPRARRTQRQRCNATKGTFAHSLCRKHTLVRDFGTFSKPRARRTQRQRCNATKGTFCAFDPSKTHARA
jgi:hypothetical protein